MDMKNFFGCLLIVVVLAALAAGAMWGVQKWADREEAMKQAAAEKRLEEVLGTEAGYRKKMVYSSVKPKVPVTGGRVSLHGVIKNNGKRNLASVTLTLDLKRKPAKTVVRTYGPIQAGAHLNITETLDAETSDRVHYAGEQYEIHITSIRFQ